MSGDGGRQRTGPSLFLTPHSCGLLPTAALGFLACGMWSCLGQPAHSREQLGPSPGRPPDMFQAAPTWNCLTSLCATR